MVKFPAAIEWSRVSLDGLAPGMPVEVALGASLWKRSSEHPELICSNSFGEPKFGFEYSVARETAGVISWIAGKTLKQGDATLFEIGTPWEWAKKALGCQGTTDVISPDGRLEINVVYGKGKIVEAIVLKFADDTEELLIE